MNLAQILWLSSSKHPDITALVDGDRRFSYRLLLERVKRLSGAMWAEGIQRGDRVAIMLPNSHEFVEIYFASLAVGAVPTPINTRLLANEVRFLLLDAEPRALFFHHSYESTVREAAGDLPFSPALVRVGSQEGTRGDELEEFSKGHAPLEDPVMMVEEEPCQLMYTSGTTGAPKGALIPHRAVLWNLVNTMHGREDREGETALIIGPLYHTAALNNHLTVQIALGGTCILIRSFDPELVLETIQEQKATTISGAPTMYHMLMEHPKACLYDLSSITKCTAGASVLPEQTRRRLESFFPNVKGIYDVYGCTEAAPTISILREGEAALKPGSVGRPVPFVEVRIADEQDQPLSPGQVGELLCRGPNVMLGYFRNESATCEALRGGWLHTGDLARMDEDCFIYIVDRKKDLIISGGENIYPREVEEALLAHPAIADAAVVGTPDPVWGEVVHAFVVKREGHRLTPEMVVEHCKGRLASYKKPKRVTLVREIPRNPSGKTLKTELRRLASRQEL
ncbi:MAG: class I adenylate-forming enzyme family protein [Thermodesulfobacteriota bacterium]